MNVYHSLMLYPSLCSKWLRRMSHELKEAKEQIQSLRKWTKQELTSSAQRSTQQQVQMVPYSNNNEYYNQTKCRPHAENLISAHFLLLLCLHCSSFFVTLA